MVFVRNWPFFHFFILALVGQENVFYSPRKCVYDILEPQNLFKAIKTNISKSRKIEIFPKGLVHGFGQQLVIFLFYYFRACRPGKCLLRYFEQKHPFLSYKNKKLKKSDKLRFFLRC